MLTSKDFRRIASRMKGALERAHMGHPDFRAKGRIFATLHSDDQWGMVKLTPEQQQDFIRANPATFVPENGAWGRQGCTSVRLDSVDEDTLGEAITLAWQNTVNKGRVDRPHPSEQPGRFGRRANAEGQRVCTTEADRWASRVPIYGSQGRRPHGMRPTARAIQELAGHPDLTTTQRYIHLSPATLGTAVQLLDRRREIVPFDSVAPLSRSGHSPSVGLP
jgi:hypothetical protein